MEKNILSKYSYLGQILITFSVSILFISLIGFFLGNSAKDVSSMYQLGGSGIAYSTIFQFLLSSIIIVTLKFLITSNLIFKNLMTLWRTIILLFCSLLVTIEFVAVFGWFPLDSVYGWICFTLSFGCCFGVSTLIMIIKTRIETKKLEKSFEEYKKAHSVEDEDE